MIVIIVLLLSLLIRSFKPSVSIAAAGNAKVYYNSSLSTGTTNAINNNLSSMGYYSVRSANPSISTLKTAIQGNNKVIHVLSHGEAGITSCSDGYLYATNVSSTSARFIFLETCYSDKAPSSGYSSARTLYHKGASCVLGFSSTITAGSASNGCHYFALALYQNAYTGLTIGTSASLAKTALYSAYGSYYGCDSYFVYGSTTTIN